jgi:hypothetical protein
MHTPSIVGTILILVASTNEETETSADTSSSEGSPDLQATNVAGSTKRKFTVTCIGTHRLHDGRQYHLAADVTGEQRTEILSRQRPLT